MKIQKFSNSRVIALLFINTLLSLYYESRYQQFQNVLLQAFHEKREKNNYVCAVIHELRNPLSAVLGSLELLTTNQWYDNNKLALVKNAYDSGEILAGMVSNILDAGKIESGMFDLNLEKIEIRQVIWKIVQVNKANAIKKKIEFEMINNPEVPKYVIIDKKRAIQVFMNLVSNAIKFTNKGQVKIVLSWQEFKNTHSKKTSDIVLATKENEYLARYRIQLKQDEKIKIQQKIQNLEYLNDDQKLQTCNLSKVFTTAQLIRPLSYSEIQLQDERAQS